jgi:hypothetical protein
VATAGATTAPVDVAMVFSTTLIITMVFQPLADRRVLVEQLLLATREFLTLLITLTLALPPMEDGRIA